MKVIITKSSLNPHTSIPMDQTITFKRNYIWDLINWHTPKLSLKVNHVYWMIQRVPWVTFFSQNQSQRWSFDLPVLYSSFQEKWRNKKKGQMAGSQDWLGLLLGKEVVKTCIQIPAIYGFITWMVPLGRRHGDPCQILDVYQREIKSWPAKKPGNGAGTSFLHFARNPSMKRNVTSLLHAKIF